MEAKSLLKKKLFSLPATLLCVLLLAPFFCFPLNTLALPQLKEFLILFFLTSFQAGVASFLSLILALLSSRGLLALVKKKYYFFIEGLILIPCFIPPLFLVLSLIQVVESFSSFPFGLPALITTQTLTYTGLCTVALVRVILKEAPVLSEWFYLQSSSAWLFFKTLLKTVLLKDIKTLFVLVFASCFTSLSLPLLVAGHSGFSLEFFIYENLKNPELWPQALTMILIQCAFIFLICFWAFSKKSFSKVYNLGEKIYLLPSVLFIIIPFFITGLCLGGLFFLLEIQALVKLWPFRFLILSSSFNSLVISLGTGGLTLLGLIALCFSFNSVWARKFIVSYIPPGVSFMGFALLILPAYDSLFVFTKWIVGLSLLMFPWIYRFRGERLLESLSSQIDMAWLMGAGEGLIFYKILWPQCRPLFFLCAGIASFWACGDLALGLILSSGHLSLSLVIYDFFSSYRLDQAIWLSWLLLFLSLISFLFWFVLALLLDKKSATKDYKRRGIW